MKKAKSPLTEASFMEELKPIESSTKSTLLIRKTLIFYPVLTETLLRQRKTRHIKYVGKLVCPQDRDLPSKLKNLKKLDNLVLRCECDGSRSCSEKRIISPLRFIKALNPFKKHVRLFHEDCDPLHPSLFAHIHFLDRLDLSIDYSLLQRKFRFITRARSIKLTISHRCAEIISKDKGILRHFERLMRLMASFRCIQRLKIRNHSNNTTLPMIAVKLKGIPSLCSSLKEFVVDLENTSLRCLRGVSRYATKMKAVSVPFDLESIQSLTRLDQLKLRVHCGDNIDLVENLVKLKKLNLEVDINYQDKFGAFLRSFSAPSCLESLTLNMNRSILKRIISTPFYYLEFPHFIKKITDLHQLKTLCLTARDQTYGSKVLKDLTTSILKKIKSLESLSLINVHFGRPDKTNPLDLSPIMDSIQELNFSIQDIAIKDVRITQKGFEQAIDLFKNKGTQRIVLEGLRIESTTGKFTEVLEKLTEVPEGRILTLKVDVEEVDGDEFAEGILKFLKRSELPVIKGEVRLHICRLPKRMKDRHKKQLKKLGAENKIFKALKVTTKHGGMVILDV